MGTSLTGLTPSTTYDALIKVGDNGALSATAKYLSDGLGNDLPLSVSTLNVGIGTNTPTTKLSIVNAATGTTEAIDLVGNSSTAKGHMGYFANALYLSSNYFFNGSQNNDTSSLGQALIVLGASAGSTSNIGFRTSAAGSTATTIRATIDADGLKFNGDTAAANALDDYEEGTWTMGISFGGGSTGITYSASGAKYTKIGRQVTVTGLIAMSNKGSSSGAAKITGLPFTVDNANGNFSATSLRLENITFTNQFQGYGEIGATTVALEEITILGAVTQLSDLDFANNSGILVSLTYFTA
jgi:hypothetical protein